MSSKRYHLIFTGRLAPGLDAATVKSNLVLDMGLSADKAEQMLTGGRAVLKRFDTVDEAYRLVTKLEQTGAICRVEDSRRVRSTSRQSESSLISFMGRFIGAGKSSALRKVR